MLHGEIMQDHTLKIRKYTRVEFGSVSRFGGAPAPAGRRTDIVQSQQPPPTYFKDAMSLPQCQLKGGIGTCKCCTPDFSSI